MKIGPYAFTLREAAGAFGDMGTLLPLAIGYIAVCGVNPAGLLVLLGLSNIALGLIYRLPLPIQPMKVIAVVAIAGHWTPAMVSAAGFTMGIVWLVFGLTGVMDRIARHTPQAVIRGIQISLGILLALEALRWMQDSWTLAAVAVAIVFALRESRYAPASLVLVALGLGLMYLQPNGFENLPHRTLLPAPVGFSLGDMWETLASAGLAQIPLTATNAVIATAALIATYWPQHPVPERHLCVNMGLMNLAVPLLGGIPLCHGAGGLAGQYYFGARTGGAPIIEGLIEVSLGLGLGASLAALFCAFPRPIIGAMMLLVGIELVKFSRDIRSRGPLAAMLTTVAVALWTNMSWAFLAGLAAHALTRRQQQPGVPQKV